MYPITILTGLHIYYRYGPPDATNPTHGSLRTPAGDPQLKCQKNMVLLGGMAIASKMTVGMPTLPWNIPFQAEGQFFHSQCMRLSMEPIHSGHPATGAEPSSPRSLLMSSGIRGCCCWSTLFHAFHSTHQGTHAIRVIMFRHGVNAWWQKMDGRTNLLY